MTQATPATPPKARVQVKSPYLCLMGLYLGAFTGMYSETALNIALPQLSAAFGVELALAQWLVVGYMLAIGIVLPLSSLLTKWFPARHITLFALVAFLAGSLISGFSTTFAVALTGRVIQGVGTGLVLPMVFSVTMEVIPPHKIGAAMGVSALVIMSATAIGPTLAGFLIGALSWHWVFFSFAIILVAAIAFTLKFLVNPYELTKPTIDVASIALSCLGFGGVVLGVGMASLYGWGAAPTLIALVVGVVALAGYAKRQLGMEVPVIDLRVLAIPGFRSAMLCVVLNFGVTLSLTYALPQFYQNGLLLSVSFAGLIMLPGGIINAAISTLAGGIYDKVGVRKPALCGFALSIVGLALLLQVSPESSLAYVIGCHIIMMVGIPLAMSPCQTHALASLPHNLSTDGSTLLNTLQQVLGAVCTALATFLLASGQNAFYGAGGNGAAQAFTQGTHWVFLFALIMAVVALGVGFTLKQPQREASTRHAGAPAAGEAAPAGPSVLSQLMKTDVFTIAEDASALDALRVLAEKGISGAPVVNAKGELAGFVSDGDIIGVLSRQHPTFGSFYALTIDSNAEEFDQRVKELSTLSVGSIATKNVLTVDVNDDMRDVCSLLAEHHLKKAPVMSNGNMVGIINRSNIAKYTMTLYAQA